MIRFEIHHLWNPDWTYAMPQQPQPQPQPQQPFGDNEATGKIVLK